ncbi:MAG: DUF308 domain-containing protein [Defluviimonas sp.]|uniref:HdeD family acid-resistance protein n=1 Tax=Albidovulum sp. TaxID=1872424 RepID=UPI001D72B982|nr:DUF308 domain-containing protein [Paracoccaceae bacterium]MCC0065018.1 DUF308 domain-containing protein [Defluviimonas sp.]
MRTQDHPQLRMSLGPAPARRLMTLGGIFAAIGVLAILLPALATLAGEALIAWMLVLWGAAGLWFAWEMRPAPEWRYGAFSFGFMLLLGVIFVLFPKAGVETLTVLMMLAFLAEGVVSIMLGLRASGRMRNWGWLIFSGACSLIVGAIILIGWPTTAVWALGLLMGANFLSTGLSLIMLAKAMRDDPVK